MKKNIIFDMGNVLIYFDREGLMEKAGVPLEDRRLVMNNVLGSVEWVMLDRGSITEEAALKRMYERLPGRLHEAARKLVYFWQWPLSPVEGMAELVRELKSKGYGLWLLSNAGLSQHEYWPHIPGSEYFDGKLISADEKLLKPEAEIYRLLLERFSLRAEDCLFIDDYPPNIEAALRCGIEGIVFRGDAAELRAELKNYGIDV